MSDNAKLLIPLLIMLAAGISLIILHFKPIKKEKANKIIGLLVICVMTASYLAAFIPTLITALTPFKLDTAPTIFARGDDYCIMWATSRPGSAKVEVVKEDGTVLTFSDAVDGVGRFDSRIHRVEIDKEILEQNGVKYRVSSRKAVNTTAYAYKLGKEVSSGYYAPKLSPPSDTAVSFFAFSDVQGADRFARKAVDKVSAEANYDFVLLLGDYSDDYNDEQDFIGPLLDLSARASGSVLPCVYVTGNHELKGTMAKEVNRLFPTPSPDNKRYFTYSYGPLFMTTLDFGDDHSDDMPRYNGVSECDAYKDEEFEWLTSTVTEEKKYEDFRYNIAVAHIPLLTTTKGTPVFTEERHCGECGKAHGYKLADFRRVLTEMNIDIMISAHSHAPKVVEHPDCVFKNIHTGSKISKGYVIKGYNCNVIRFEGDKCVNTLYNHKGEKAETVINLPARPAA